MPGDPRRPGHYGRSHDPIDALLIRRHEREDRRPTPRAHGHARGSVAGPEEGPSMSIVEVSQLTKSYDDKVVVDGVSFAVEEGEIFAILGPNGAGKSTTVESIAGLRTPDSGHIEVFGFDPLRDRAQVRELLGVQLQESRFQDRVKVREVVETFAALYPDPVDVSELHRAPRSRRQGRNAVRPALRRSAAASVDRRRARRTTPRGDPRRTDHGPRPAGSTRDLGAGRGAPRRRHDGGARHALHGGSRAAGRPIGVDRPGAARRPRHAAGADRQRRTRATHPVHHLRSTSTTSG